MKTLTTIILLVLLSTVYCKCMPLIGADSLICLEITGRISHTEGFTDNTYKVELIKNNRVIDSMEIKDKKTFKFVLKKNEYYGIRISKKGFIPRLISVCTEFKDEGSENKFFRFHFDTTLLSEKESENLNKDALDFPIALIAFNNKKGLFYYSKTYTAEIKRRLNNQEVSCKN